MRQASHSRDGSARLDRDPQWNDPQLNLARAAVEGMLSGLGAGLDALREAGVPLRRALLIGGGAQSAAVRAIAPEVFGIPVDVPAAAEYVALGAARQASSILLESPS